MRLQLIPVAARGIPLAAEFFLRAPPRSSDLQRRSAPDSMAIQLVAERQFGSNLDRLLHRTGTAFAAIWDTR